MAATPYCSARQFSIPGIPFVFDPGQGLPMFGKENCALHRAGRKVTLNDYEAKMLCDRTGLSCAEISRQVRGLVVTLGAQGCGSGLTARKRLSRPFMRNPWSIRRGAAMLFAAPCCMDWSKAGLWRAARLGNQVGARKIASRGGRTTP